MSMVKVEKLLKLHEKFMRIFNERIPQVNRVSNNNVRAFEEYVRDSIPILAFNEFDFDEAPEQDKIKIAGAKAFEIAKSYSIMKSDSIAESYNNGKISEQFIIKFSAAYKAALRIELYRQFFGMNQEDLEKLKEKFLKTNPKAKATLQEIYQFLVDEVKVKIDTEFNRLIKRKDSLSPKDQFYIHDMKTRLDNLYKSLLDKREEVQSDTTGELLKSLQDATLEFEIKAGRCIRGVKINDKAFLLNIILLFSVIGTIPAIASILHHLIKGKYLLFDHCIELRRARPEESAAEDQLIGNSLLTLPNLK